SPAAPPPVEGREEARERGDGGGPRSARRPAGRKGVHTGGARERSLRPPFGRRGAPPHAPRARRGQLQPPRRTVHGVGNGGGALRGHRPRPRGRAVAWKSAARDGLPGEAL